MRSKLIVHISSTPLSGSPIQIVEAINKHSNFQARLVNLNPSAYKNFDENSPLSKNSFKEDLKWPEDKDEIFKCIEIADIIHVHQAIDLKENKLGINFYELLKQGKKFVRQWHSEPEHYMEWLGVSPSDFKEDFPHLVVSQYHERFYPWAVPVPNIICNSLIDSSYNESFDWRTPKIVFSPSNKNSPVKKRWASKGYHETLRILDRVKRSTGVEFEVLFDTPHDEVISAKSKCTIVIDDIVTGSYHRSGLEGLALGKATFSYLDQRTATTLGIITGTSTNPFILSSARSLEEMLKAVIKLPDLGKSIGDFSRIWFKKFYDEEIMIRHYMNVYKKVLSENDLEGLFPSRADHSFLFKTQYDIAHKYNLGDL